MSIAYCKVVLVLLDGIIIHYPVLLYISFVILHFNESSVRVDTRVEIRVAERTRNCPELPYGRAVEVTS